MSCPTAVTSFFQSWRRRIQTQSSPTPFPTMYSFKPKNCLRLIGMRSFLALLLGLLAVSAAPAQTYNWKPVQLHGSGFVSGILFHPNAPGLMYCRTDIGGAYRWN